MATSVVPRAMRPSTGDKAGSTNINVKLKAGETVYSGDILMAATDAGDEPCVTNQVPASGASLNFFGFAIADARGGVSGKNIAAQVSGRVYTYNTGTETINAGDDVFIMSDGEGFTKRFPGDDATSADVNIRRPITVTRGKVGVDRLNTENRVVAYLQYMNIRTENPKKSAAYLKAIPGYKELVDKHGFSDTNTEDKAGELAALTSLTAGDMVGVLKEMTRVINFCNGARVGKAMSRAEPGELLHLIL